MSLLDVIYPKFCLGCGTFGTYCCTNCLRSLPPLSVLKCPKCEKVTPDGRTHPWCQTKYGLDGLISFYPYRGIIQKAIKGIKYRLAFRIAGDVLQSIPEKQQLLINKIIKTEHAVMLIPIPLHASRQRVRGFNQAEIIAHRLSTLLSVSIQAGILERVVKTQPQVEMRYRNERFKNMKHVFAIKKRNPYSIQGASVFLVDDVFTTGATLQSATEVLKRAGAKHVFGITIAQ